jgi:hypothetical protein
MDSSAENLRSGLGWQPGEVCLEGCLSFAAHVVAGGQRIHREKTQIAEKKETYHGDTEGSYGGRIRALAEMDG